MSQTKGSRRLGASRAGHGGTEQWPVPHAGHARPPHGPAPTALPGGGCYLTRQPRRAPSPCPSAGGARAPEECDGQIKKLWPRNQK